MAITIDRSVFPYVINVPKSYMLVIQTNPSEIYQLDMNAFRLDLKDLEDDVAHMPFTRTHWHNAGVTVSGAVLARVVVITDDYVVEFEDGQYRVNVVGANTNIGERTVVNQVSVSTSNSAGLQDLNSLQAASFAGQVALDVNSSYSGTVFPVGTRGYPVNNTTDCLAILQERGINNVAIMSSMTLNSGTDFSADAVAFVGDNAAAVTVTLDPNVDIENCQFMNMTVTGTLDGNNVIRDCAVVNLTYTNGFLHRCGLFGTITLGGGQATITNCYSGIAGGGAGQYAVIDMGGAGNTLALRDYSGGLKIQNGTGADDSSLDFSSGRLIVDSTITAGEYTVRGIADVTDNSTGTAVVSDRTITKTIELVRDITDGKLVTDPATGVMTLYDEDGVTPIRTWPLWEDVDATQPYRGQGSEHRGAPTDLT